MQLVDGSRFRQDAWPSVKIPLRHFHNHLLQFTLETLHTGNVDNGLWQKVVRSNQSEDAFAKHVSVTIPFHELAIVSSQNRMKTRRVAEKSWTGWQCAWKKLRQLRRCQTQRNYALFLEICSRRPYTVRLPEPAPSFATALSILKIEFRCFFCLQTSNTRVSQHPIKRNNTAQAM